MSLHIQHLSAYPTSLCISDISDLCELQEFAGEGLRTLVLAHKELDEAYFQSWKARHHEASTALEEREEKLDELYEEIEKDLVVCNRPCQ